MFPARSAIRARLFPVSGDSPVQARQPRRPYQVCDGAAHRVRDDDVGDELGGVARTEIWSPGGVCMTRRPTNPHER